MKGYCDYSLCLGEWGCEATGEYQLVRKTRQCRFNETQLAVYLFTTSQSSLSYISSS